MAKKKNCLVFLAILAGLLVESCMNLLSDAYPWTISQPASAALYFLLFNFLFYLFYLTDSKRIAVLAVMSFTYGTLLVATLDGYYYTFLSGFMWRDAVNLNTIYRLIEIAVFIRTVRDARFINWVCDTVLHIIVRPARFVSAIVFTKGQI